MAAETWVALRQIMYQPSAVWLGTEYSGDRWLTDQFVMLCVSQYEEFGELPDGPYKLVGNKFTPVEIPGHAEERDAVPEPDFEEYFRAVNHRDWRPAEPTEWSVQESENDRAMLWNASGTPALLGRETWKAIHRHYPEVRVRHSFRGNSCFRFYDGDVTFCYAAGIRIPDGEKATAEIIVGGGP